MTADQYGNVPCKKCGALQGRHNRACHACYAHKKLLFTEEWSGGWQLAVECEECGKDYGFSIALLSRQYEVKKVKQ